jgi:hypothetical protein
MSGDLVGPMEARLLELERRQARLDHSLHSVGREVVALGQGIWDAWSDFPPLKVQSPTGHGGTIPGCTSALATTLYVRDPVYGAITLQWDGAAMWTACKSVNYFGYGGNCVAVNGVAVWYDLLNTGIFRMRWASNVPTTTRCPIASTCASTPNCTAQQLNPITIESCVPFRASMLVGIGGGFVVYGNAVNAGVRIDFSESPL